MGYNYIPPLRRRGGRTNKFCTVLENVIILDTHQQHELQLNLEFVQKMVKKNENLFTSKIQGLTYLEATFWLLSKHWALQLWFSRLLALRLSEIFCEIPFSVFCFDSMKSRNLSYIGQFPLSVIFPYLIICIICSLGIYLESNRMKLKNTFLYEFLLQSVFVLCLEISVHILLTI